MNQAINIPEYEVSQFNKLLKDIIEDNFDYIRIRGEISELKNAPSGHIYLTLKDNFSVLNATIWKQKKDNLVISPEIGMEVIVSGKISTYAKSISTYSINIDNIELAGEGALLKIIEERKHKLKAKGLFDDKYKKQIPLYPDKLGIITSPTGSVIHDIINRVKDRFPLSIEIWPAKVQGIDASKNIIQAIEGFNNKNYIKKPDIIIIARGGGSTEDLMPFNDEDLAFSVFNSTIPIISAIGHETDTTIIDYISDLRVSTPTAAIEKALPVKNELNKLIKNLSEKINYQVINNYKKYINEFSNLTKYLKAPNFIINSYKEKIHFITEKLFSGFFNNIENQSNQLKYYIKILRSPEFNINSMKNYLKITFKSLDKNILLQKNFNNNELIKFNRLLQSNSIHNNLQKGYSLIKKDKKIINNSNVIKEKDIIDIQFLDKIIKLDIKKIN